MKKFIWFLAGMMFATTVSVFALSPVIYDFNDRESFEDTWYYESAMAMLDRQIIHGDDDGNFNPNDDVNRAEMAVMLDRTIDYVRSSRDNDVASNNYDLLEALSALDLLSDATEEEIAFVSVSMGEHQLDWEAYWWTSLDEYLVDLVEDDDCEEEDLVLNDEEVDDYVVYDCDNYFYIYDEDNETLHGNF